VCACDVGRGFSDRMGSDWLLMTLASRSWERSIKRGREHRREVERRIEMMERGMMSSRKLPTDEAPHQSTRPIRQG
jgi:hypothetical protein